MKLKYLLLTCLTVSGLNVVAADQQTAADLDTFSLDCENLIPGDFNAVEVVAEPGQRPSSLFAGSALFAQGDMLPDTETPDGTANAVFSHVFTAAPTEDEEAEFNHWYNMVENSKDELLDGLRVYAYKKKFNDKINTKINVLTDQEEQQRKEMHSKRRAATPPLERQGASRALAASAALGPLLTRAPVSRNLKPSPVVATSSAQPDVDAIEKEVAEIEERTPQRGSGLGFVTSKGISLAAPAPAIEAYLLDVPDKDLEQIETEEIADIRQASYPQQKLMMCDDSLGKIEKNLNRLQLPTSDKARQELLVAKANRLKTEVLMLKSMAEGQAQADFPAYYPPKRNWKPWLAMGAGVVAVAAAIVWYLKGFKPTATVA